MECVYAYVNWMAHTDGKVIERKCTEPTNDGNDDDDDDDYDYDDDDGSATTCIVLQLSHSHNTRWDDECMSH